MHFLDLFDISEKYIEIINPTSENKLLRAGQVAGMKPGRRVIDFGCGYAAPMVLWAEQLGIGGVGVEFRTKAVERARKKVAEHGQSDRIEIVEANGAEYAFEKNSFHVASALGSTFIWKDFRGAIRAMKEALTPDGKLLVGEVYWNTDQAPPEYRSIETLCSQRQLLDTAREEGFDIEFVIPSSYEEWDNYETANWIGLLECIEANEDHPERQEVIDHLHQHQEDYLTYQRKYVGWALFILNPVKY